MGEPSRLAWRKAVYQAGSKLYRRRRAAVMMEVYGSPAR